jgi:ABC-type branched-subunit amino acid transport system substrate-binding protein
MSLCLDPTIQKESPLVFRLYESMGQEAEALLAYFNDANANAKMRVGLLYVDHPGTAQEVNDYFIPGFKKLGVNLALSEPYQITQKDFKDIAAKIKGKNLTHLIVISYGFENPAIFRDLKSSGFKGQILGGWGFVAINALPAADVEGTVVAAPEYLLGSGSAAAEFNQKFSAKFGKQPNYDAAFSFNAVMMLAEAARRGGPEATPKTLAKALAELGTYDGIFGTATISPDREFSVPLVLAVWRSGRLQRYEAPAR